jgi:hypothetical protein
MKNKYHSTVDLKCGPNQRPPLKSTDETCIRYTTSTKIKQSTTGQGKPSRFFVGRVVPLEVYQKGGLSDQNHPFQPLMLRLSVKTLTVDLETTRINDRGAIRRSK